MRPNFSRGDLEIVETRTMESLQLCFVKIAYLGSNGKHLYIRQEHLR